MLGYGKMLIDRVLCASIEHSGRKPCLDDSLDELTKLKKNIEILLDWTVPKMYLERFQREQRTIEDILEELTSWRLVSLFAMIISFIAKSCMVAFVLPYIFHCHHYVVLAKQAGGCSLALHLC